MKRLAFHKLLVSFAIMALPAPSLTAHIGSRFPSEKKTVEDKITGAQLTFLTSQGPGDFGICNTGRQWTADGNWIIFRSNRAPGETLAINEKTGDMVQVTEGSYMGVTAVSDKSMKLFFMRMTLRQPGQSGGGPVQIVEVDLERLLADSESGDVRDESEYQKVRGTIPAGMEAGGSMSIDAGGEWLYFRVGRAEASKHAAQVNPADRGYSQHPAGEILSGISSFNIRTREIRFVLGLPFRVGRIRADQKVSGELYFCGEKDGTNPLQTWSVRSDGTGLRTVCGGPQPKWPAGSGSVLMHHPASSDDRLASGSDAGGNIYLADLHSDKTILLSAGHKTTSADPPCPSVSPDETKVLILSAMLSSDTRRLNLCIIKIPDGWQGSKQTGY
ncbi:MAG TPA: hypothetical protein PKY14_00080 [Bacteroidales bacterium]|jgi:oligogalacturonide lyase|nr:hypothetical protein [Bacteroidales bacterium]HPM17646.1 hypothetical protein [Bacteroidales bacterium]HPV15735.1 hypothetical protein [Bacteroidales bacterium]HQG75908.1 hypothetical protein [Bacteroidales bacterium]